jgi:hypothetical protein
MKTCIRAVSAILLSSIMYPTGAAAQAPGPRPVLTVPVVGTFQGGGDFNGTISVNRFEQRGAQVVAVGFVSGVLTRANHTRGTAVAGEMAWPVVVRSGGTSLARGFAPEKAVPMLVAYRPEPTAPRFLLAQSTPPCPVLDIALGPITVNLLGAQVALSAVSFSLSGQTGPLGDLVCAASDLLGNVAGVVNLLNSVLGLVTGLLGGLTGGLGGAVPVP